MQQHQVGIAGITLLTTLAIAPTAPAQPIPDNTLGGESSVVTPNVTVNGNPANLIEGGAERGSNLFHSFAEFNIGNGQYVYFANPLGIANIFSRVTGNSLSNIDGTLGVNGIANLFLLNPNGIVFSESARLDLQGSFFASSGSAFLFEDGSEFSAVNPDLPPQILTVNITPGIQYGNQNGPITLDGGDLSVDAGQNITLAAGGNLTIQNGGELDTSTFASAGQAADAGNLLLTSENGNIQLIETELETESNTFTNSGKVANAGRGGDIKIMANSGEIKVIGSVLSTHTFSNTGSANDAGDITLTAFGNIHILDQGPEDTDLDTTSVAEGDSGRGGNITIMSEAGGITVVDSFFRTDTDSDDGNAPDGGNITLISGKGDLNVIDGELSTTTQSIVGTSGNSGNITLTATKGDINVTKNSELFAESSSYLNNAGRGGDIRLTTQSGNIFIVNTGRFISSESTSNFGNAGNGGSIIFEANFGDIKIENSGIRSETFSDTGDAGDAGDISFQAQDGDILIDNRGISAGSNVEQGKAGRGGAVSFVTNNGDILIDGNNQEIFSSSFSRFGDASPGSDLSFITGNGDIEIVNSRIRSGSIANPGEGVTLKDVNTPGNADDGGASHFCEDTASVLT